MGPSLKNVVIRKTLIKLCIQTFTTLLIIVVILLTGCNGDQQKPPEQVEPQADTQKDVTTFPEADADTTLPTTFYPPKNPYEYLTVTGTAPTSDYIYKTGAEYLWIPEFDYEWEIGEIPQVTLPVAPNHAWKWARYEQREKEIWDKFKKRMEGVTSEKVINDMYREHQAQLEDIKAEIMTEGMTPLNAAKYLMAHNIYTDYKMQYAQQAVDDNPNDFHTQLVWTWTQNEFDKMKEGYRRLVEIRPNSAYAFYWLGRYTHSADAIPILKKAYQYAPDVPTNHPGSLKVAILLKLAQAYYRWYSVEAEAKAKALETLKYMSKYDSGLAQKCITQMQTEKRIGMYTRIQKENTNE